MYFLFRESEDTKKTFHVLKPAQVDWKDFQNTSILLYSWVKFERRVILC